MHSLFWYIPNVILLRNLYFDSEVKSRGKRTADKLACSTFASLLRPFNFLWQAIKLQLFNLLVYEGTDVYFSTGVRGL